MSQEKKIIVALSHKRHYDKLWKDFPVILEFKKMIFVYYLFVRMLIQ